jgi:hypothetical protein
MHNPLLVELIAGIKPQGPVILVCDVGKFILQHILIEQRVRILLLYVRVFRAKYLSTDDAQHVYLRYGIGIVSEQIIAITN